MGNRNKSQTCFPFRQLPWLTHELRSHGFVLHEDEFTLWLGKWADRSSSIYPQASMSLVGTDTSKPWLKKGWEGLIRPRLETPSKGWSGPSPVCAKYQGTIKIRKHTTWAVWAPLFSCNYGLIGCHIDPQQLPPWPKPSVLSLPSTL